MAPNRSRTRPPTLVGLAVDALALWRQGAMSPREALARVAPADLPEDRRAHLARVVYGTIRDERLLSHALGDRRLAECDDSAEQDAALILAFRVADGELDATQAAARLPKRSGVAAWDFRRAEQLDALAEEVEDPALAFALRHSLPDWLAARLVAEFGQDAEAVAAAMRCDPPRMLRANRLRVASRGELAAQLADEGVTTSFARFAADGIEVVGEAALFQLASYRSGALEQQDEGSQLIAMAVAPPPRGKVLDACAGSGGKTLALAAMLAGRGSVLAVDPSERRLDALRQRARRAGASNVRCLDVAEDRWPDEVAAFARAADRILLDVPCSGTGSLRRRPETRWSLLPTDVDNLLAVQRDLLDRAASALKPGARVVYATCSLLREENEEQVRAALTRHAHLELVRLAEVVGGKLATPISDASGSFLQVRPDTHGCDGFFAAILRHRRGAGD